MTEKITITLYPNTFQMRHYDRYNSDGSITIMNVTDEVTPDGVIINSEEREGVTFRYEY